MKCKMPKLEQKRFYSFIDELQSFFTQKLNSLKLLTDQEMKILQVRRSEITWYVYDARTVSDKYGTVMFVVKEAMKEGEDK